MRLLGRLLAIPTLAAALPAAAQSIDDSEVCSQILQQRRSGLYVAAPNGGRVSWHRVGSGPLAYSPAMRLYYVPPHGPRTSGREGVWHIRTQTRAAAALGANQAYVYRAGRRTRCSARLPEWQPDERFIGLNRYIDHHAAARNARERDELSTFFHFDIRDNGQCIPTDGPAFGNLERHYGFEETPRIPGDLEVTLSPIRPAYADSRYAGLSSEFAYHDYEANPAPACLGFTAPLPTRAVRSVMPWLFSSGRYAQALRAAQEWQPSRTLVVVKRLTGRSVREVLRSTIVWTGRP